MRAEALLAAALLAASAARAEEPEGRVVLRWQPVQGAAGYDLQISADPSFTRRELEQRVDAPGYRLDRPPEARRYWRVRSVDADGRAGPWSVAKTIEPPGAPPAPAPNAGEPRRAPAIAPSATRPLRPAPPPAARLEPGPEIPPLLPVAGAAPTDAAQLPGGGRDAPGWSDWLRQGRPGAMIGWHDDLLGISAPVLALEGAWPLPPLGPWASAALRAGWWRARATVPLAPGLGGGLEATADVFPVALVAFASFPVTWARVYAGVGAGADLAVIRLRREGALEASPRALAVAGAGRRLGPGEGFAEAEGGVGGVGGPLGRLRTGGFSLSVGYRLVR